MADFEAALEADEDNWRALHNRGVTLAQNGDFANAFDDFSRVVQLSPQFPKAYSNRATLYVQAGQAELALGDFDQALQLDPDLFAAHVGRGRICHQMGLLDEALAHMNAAVEIDGENSEVICSRADLHADLGNYAEALRDYARAIDLRPDFAHAYRNGAWLLATCPDERFRDVENAIAGAQQALDFGYGQRHAALDTLAAALASAGRFEEAVSTLQQAIEVAPEEARGAYEVRLNLYEVRQPFRINPVESATSAK
jgi:tetratricopeptide (TPR) repeat protein